MDGANSMDNLQLLSQVCEVLKEYKFKQNAQIQWIAALKLYHIIVLKCLSHGI